MPPIFDKVVGRSVLHDGYLYVKIQSWKNGRCYHGRVSVSPNDPSSKASGHKYTMNPATRIMQLIPELRVSSKGLATSYIWQTQFMACPKGEEPAKFHREFNKDIGESQGEEITKWIERNGIR
jgi:hypothetical protein